MDIGTFAFLAVMGFMAAFIDSVAGGGGIISIPALMCTGLPPITVLGTNKVAAVMGAVTSFITYARSGKVDMPLMKKAFPLSVIGSALGVFTVRSLSPEILRPMVIVLLIVVAIYSVMKKDWGQDDSVRPAKNAKLLIGGLGAAFVFGYYDGFFGPGAGSFMLFAYLWLGYDYVSAVGNARTLNFGSNMAAAVLFSLLGNVDFSYSIPMGCFMILGAYCGSRMAITKGATYVRPLFIVMTTVLIGKQLFDFLK